ncbi:bifunctional polysaccharide deacetylase/glycosyltransferase family 2 protein [Carbonactinospora thermoautotrophica]|uniref:bifunctional polysaccharide deacetylase/glycosyltransferase family 2 protein n=1 Tax=Carbonactinospora thermoautotrophica TaxID=1469144 RepID=UPI000D172B94
MAIIAFVVFWCFLLVNGLVHSEIGLDQRISPPVDASHVPDQIRNGGPIIDTVHQPARSYQVPPKTVVLTFDDGPDPRWTPEVLRVLRKHRVPGTFFIVGSLATRYPEIIREMRESGAEIGIHTFTHPDLVYAAGWRRQLELSESQLAIAGAAGVTTSLVRPPYSSMSRALNNATWPVVQDTGRLGYFTVLTTHDTKDWQRPGVDAIVRNGIPRGGVGGIILLHDAGGDRSQTVAALDRLIPELRKKGYRFSTVAGVLRQPTANPEADPAERWRGVTLVTAVRVATFVIAVCAAALLVTGVLILARLLLMLAFASRHARRRKSRDWSWGPPVTEPVSVIVPAYNEKECIADTVRSLVASDHPVEVIVVDDGSTDGTADIVESLRLPNVTVIRKPNGGKPSALNTGIMHARHDLIVMMDGDTVFERDTIRRLVQPFADPEVGAVAGNAKVANRRSLIGRWQHIEYVIGFNIDRRVYDILRCMPTVPGAVGAFRRQALLQVGGVSDDTLAEDTDLTMAICRAGWRVVYEETARAWTETPATLGQLWRQRYRWSYGTIQSMWKHRRALFEGGPSGRFGWFGLLSLALFQVLLPLLAPLVDVFLVYGLLFLDPLKTFLAWLAVLLVQLLSGAYAFRLDREPLRTLWLMPLQQFVYRQLMYLVLIQSVVTALTGVRLRWQKLTRSGGLNAILATETGRPRD